MLRKLLLVIFVLLLLPCVMAAEKQIIYDIDLEDPYEKGGHAYPIGLKMFNTEQAQAVAAMDGSITTSEDGKSEIISGQIYIPSMAVTDKGQEVKQDLVINGAVTLTRRIYQTKIEGQKKLWTILMFKVSTGQVTLGDHILKCSSGKDCTITVELPGDETRTLWPWINIDGMAEVTRKSDSDFAPVIIEDIKNSIFWSESREIDGEQANLFKLIGLPAKKTSRFESALLQSKKRLLFTTRYRENEKNQVMVEVIAGNAYLRNMPEDTTFFVYPNKKPKLVLMVDNQKKLSILSGIISLYDDLRDYRICADSEDSCILVDHSTIKIKPYTIDRLPMKTVVYPDNKREIVFDRIPPTDTSSTYLSSTNKKLKFSSKKMDKIPKKTDVFSFKTDFIAQLYSDKDKRYHEYKCKWKERKCYYDGKPVKRGFSDLRLCEVDEDCLEGEFCSRDPKCPREEEELCGEKRCLKESVCEAETESFNPGRILFVADGYTFSSAGEKKFREDVKELMYEGLFMMDPFNTIETRAAFTIIYMNVGSLPSGFDGVPVMDLAQNYRDKCEEQISKNIPYTIVVSKGGKSYRAWSHGKRELIVVPVSSGMITEADKRLFIHEFGHLFANLADEYVGTTTRFSPPYNQFPNCAKDEYEARFWLKKMGMNDEAYGNFKYKGCGGDCPGGYCSHYIRPDENSIMAGHLTGDFNEPSKWQIKNATRELTGIGGLLNLPLE